MSWGLGKGAFVEFVDVSLVTHWVQEAALSFSGKDVRVTLGLGVEEAVCVCVQLYVYTGEGQMTDGVFDLLRKPYRNPKLLPLLPVPV